MKSSYLIIIFLLLGPILDVASFLGTSVSILIRGLFLGCIIIYLVIKRKHLKIMIPYLYLV